MVKSVELGLSHLALEVRYLDDALELKYYLDASVWPV